jgi:2-polyprenyl-3-methyl-5-hydroxy-6-metoxy-1,4-benzoquinol methylase
MAEIVDPYIGWKNWGEDSFGQFDSLEARYYAAETGIRKVAAARVLEIGFGNGSFIGWARSVNIDVFGVELNSTLVARARTLLGEDHVFHDLDDAGLTDLAGTFSHIVAFDVIEHIAQSDLPHFLAQLRMLLTAHGRLILRFPNGDSPFGRVNQHGDPTHLTTLGRGKLCFLAIQAGFAVEAVRAPKLPLTGIGIGRTLRRTALRLGRYIVEHLVGFLYFGGRVIPLDANYVGVLVRSEIIEDKLSPTAQQSANRTHG